MGNPVMHWEMMTKKPEKLSAFYKKIFNWEIRFLPDLNYRMVETGSKLGIKGGIFKPKRSGPWPAKMTAYIGVENLAPYRRKIVAGGGKILIREQKIPGVGALSLFLDPDGRMMGLFKPLHPKTKKS